MDFPGVFVWRYPTIVYSHPTETIQVPEPDGNGGFRTVRKRKQRYMYVATAGFPGIAMGTYICLSANPDLAGRRHECSEISQPSP